MKTRLRLLALALLIMVGAPLWWPAAADFLRPRQNGSDLPPSSAAGKRFAMEEVVFTQSQAGRPEWHITAERLATAPGRESELHLEAVRAVLARESGDQLAITGGEAVYDQEDLVLTLTDDVRVQMPNGYELHTEVLRYLDRAGRVETSAPVRLLGGDLRVSGRGMGYELRSGSYWVGGRVDVLLQ